MSSSKGMSIPGYYFGANPFLAFETRDPVGLNIFLDEAKQKYFKVLSNGQAPPGSRYSQGNVVKLRDETRVSHRKCLIASSSIANS